METAHVIDTADGARVAYRRWHAQHASALPPLVLMHGAASNMTRWSEFVDRTSLTDRRDVLRLDLRGHGDSRYRGKIGLEIWADDLAQILVRERISKAIVGGHCLGANVAAFFAARHPNLTAGAVLVEPMLRPALTGVMARLSPFVPALTLVIAVIRLGNRFGIYRRHLETLDLRELDREFRDRLSQPGGGEALVRRYASPLQDLKIMPSANFFQDLVEVLRPLPLDRLGTSFLALLSTGRTFADPDITQRLLAPLPGGTVQTVEAKHWIPTEQPEPMRRAIDAWCNGLPG